MNRKVKRKIIYHALFYFLIIVAFKIRSLNPNKDLLITYSLWIIIGAYIIYESYKQFKINKTKKEKGKEHVSRLLMNRKRFEPKIITSNIPEDLKEHIPLLLKWGISNKILRTDLFENSTDSDLKELKKIESKTDLITNWINSDSNADIEKKAFQLTLDAYNELGLWTWNKAHEPNNGEHAGPL